MSSFRLAASYIGHNDKTKRPDKPRWLLKYKMQDILRLPVKTPLRRSFVYWTKLYWATPPWFTESMQKEMKEIYETCPEGFNVDHIVPLDSKIVCGLHVPWNLQHMTFKANMTKSNKWWPHHPFENQDLFPPIGDHERQRVLL